LDLIKLTLTDSANVLLHEAQRHQRQPLYVQEDVDKMSRLAAGANYRTPIVLDEHVKIEFFDAGHILGSSMIRITVDGVSVVFSGDIGNPPVPLLLPTDVIGEANYVVMESTYGGRTHEDPATRALMLGSAIYETVTMKGTLMIPAFAMERTQEILYELNNLVNQRDIPPVPIFLDSPLAIKATEVFTVYRDWLNPEAHEVLAKDSDLFTFPGLVMTKATEASRAILKQPAPKVIIAGSGMAQGGRIVHHIQNYIEGYENQYLIVGYQVHGSLGRKLLDGEKVVHVAGKELNVHAKVHAIGGYSAHADQPKLTKWIKGFNPSSLKKIFLTRGEEDQALALQAHFQAQITTPVEVPLVGQTIEL
jgi:metallo-beta-lactamase family protein